ncbi:MAG: PorV/PorQ family protein [Chlorobi bacterium]|nr:PorV/PorQ family protein [Chlorobiota bacterium]
MKKRIINILCFLLVFNMHNIALFAGNEQRAGQAGASELLINPWARTSGFGGANVASVRGLEAVYLNVAGTAFTRSTELIFARTNWFVGSDIHINSFGLSQKVGESGVLSLAIMSLDIGEIEITTVELPDGGLGTFHPQYTNISISFAKEFSNSIYGGLTMKIVSGGIADLKTSGVAFDAGIQYVTGKAEQIKFGITLKNVGPPMSYKGDGMSFRGTVPTGVIMTVEQRSAEFELPSLIKIGATYDFYLSENLTLTTAANFTSNSFTKDQYHLGMELSIMKMLDLRGGFIYEKGILDDSRQTAFTGPAFGASVNIPLNKEKGSTFSVDYSYRFTDPFFGVHTIGAKVSL